MMKRNLIHSFMILFLSLILLSSGCSETMEKQTSTLPIDNMAVNVGVFESSTGHNASTGSEVIKGINLAQSIYPTALNRNIHLIYKDARSDDVAVVEALKELVEKDKVIALIGSTSSTNSIAAAPYIAQFQIPTVGATCTNPMVTAGNPYYVRVCFTDAYQGSAMARYLYNDMHIRRVAIINDRTNDYAIGLANYFSKTFNDLSSGKDGTMIQANYVRGDRDFTAQLTSIKSAHVDAIFAPGNDVESALFIQQARDMGLTIPVAGGDSWESDAFLATGGANLEGALFSTMFSSEKPPTHESQKFIAAYKKKYGTLPTSSAALGYDAYLVLIRAIERAGSSDSNAINQALRKLQDVEGATGLLNFDENGNALNNIILKQVVKGQFTYKATLK